MVLCAAMLAVVAVVWLAQKKRLMAGTRKMLAVLAAASSFGLLAGICGTGERRLVDGAGLRRNPFGEGSYEESVELSVDGLLEPYSYSIEVPEQNITRTEEEAYLAAARKEIQEEFPGKNASTDCIREQVVIRESYQDGKVEAEWRFDNYDVIDFSGKVTAQEFSAEGELVQASVWLECGASGCNMEFCFRVFPPLLDDRQEFFSLLKKELDRQGEMEGTDFLTLPLEVGGYTVTWREKQEHLPEKIFFPGCIAAVLMPLLERSREQERQKKRESLLRTEYPDMVSKLTLLLGAGMTVQRAFQKIAFSYEEKRKVHAVSRKPAYEEMLITCREIESGVGEEKGYQRFGERCALAEYRKFGSILAQNLRKGGKAMTSLLEKEVENAYENRISTAKKCGEEAAAKMLFPMMLMLGMIMVILLVPAVSAFQL